MATCQLLHAGNGMIHPELQQLVGIHDQVTQASAPLPLA